jgi:hypothetical protein
MAATPAPTEAEQTDAVFATTPTEIDQGSARPEGATAPPPPPPPLLFHG